MFDLFMSRVQRCVHVGVFEAAHRPLCETCVLTCSSAVSEVLGNAAKEPPEGQPTPQDGKNSKGTKTSTRLPLPSSALLTPPLFLFAAPSVQQRSQLEELRKFGKEFRVKLALRGPALWVFFSLPDWLQTVKSCLLKKINK